MLVSAGALYFGNNAQIQPPAISDPSSCITNMTLTDLSCEPSGYSGSLRFNNTFIFFSNNSIGSAPETYIAARQILLCAPTVTIPESMYVTTEAMGCGANYGPGAGGTPSSNAHYGGGGGAFGGYGGRGYDRHNGGKEYAGYHRISAGSGGGCSGCKNSSAAGGGIINVIASKSIIMNGNLTSNGANGHLAGAGGGAGGTVIIDTVYFTGSGYITARGGAGGRGEYPGGGGGGGAVALINYKRMDATFVFNGFVLVDGGRAGVLTSAAAARWDQQLVESSVPWNASLVQQQRHLRSGANGAIGGVNIYSSYSSSPIAGVNGFAVNPFSHGSLFSNDDDGSSPDATDGGAGITSLPVCLPGYGNDIETGQICAICPVGTYNEGLSSEPCQNCENKPLHAYYTELGETTSSCEYTCDQGYQTTHCYSQFQYFIFVTLGVTYFSILCVGFFFIVMAPLTYTRLKRKYDWFSKDDVQQSGLKKIFGDFFLGHDNDDDVFFETDKATGRTSIQMKNFSSHNPLAGAGGDSPKQNKNGNDYDGDFNGGDGRYSDSYGSRIRTLRSKFFVDRRKEHRMLDQDLVFHAYRVNLMGSNHPWKSYGKLI
jgi:hypothetical protein